MDFLPFKDSVEVRWNVMLKQDDVMLKQDVGGIPKFAIILSIQFPSGGEELKFQGVELGKFVKEMIQGKKRQSSNCETGCPLP